MQNKSARRWTTRAVLGAVTLGATGLALAPAAMAGTGVAKPISPTSSAYLRSTTEIVAGIGAKPVAGVPCGAACLRARAAVKPLAGSKPGTPAFKIAKGLQGLSTEIGSFPPETALAGYTSYRTGERAGWSIEQPGLDPTFYTTSPTTPPLTGEGQYFLSQYIAKGKSIQGLVPSPISGFLLMHPDDVQFADNCNAPSSWPSSAQAPAGTVRVSLLSKAEGGDCDYSARIFPIANFAITRGDDLNYSGPVANRGISGSPITGWGAPKDAASSDALIRTRLDAAPATQAELRGWLASQISPRCNRDPLATSVVIPAPVTGESAQAYADCLATLGLVATTRPSSVASADLNRPVGSVLRVSQAAGARVARGTAVVIDSNTELTGALKAAYDRILAANVAVAGQAAFKKVATEVALSCVKLALLQSTSSARCGQKGLPIYVSGAGTTLEATRHVIDAQGLNPRYAGRRRAAWWQLNAVTKPATVWYAKQRVDDGTALCTPTSTRSCDQFPFLKTRQGGPQSTATLRPHLRLVAKAAGTAQATAVNSFVAGCRAKRVLPEGGAFLVLPTTQSPTQSICNAG